MEDTRDRWRTPLALWGAVFAVLQVAQRLGQRWWPPPGTDPPLVPDSAFGWAAPWLQFDAWDYVAIAESGYPQTDGRTLAVWFPAYPLVMRGGSWLVGSEPVAAVVVAAAAGALALVALWRWLAVVCEDPRVARTALVLGAVYPYGWFLYGGAYSTSLLVASAIGAFWAWERDRTALAGLLAAAATLAHPTAVAVIVGLAVAEVHASRTAQRPMRWGVAWSGIGLVAYSAYLGVTNGNPLLWLTGRSDYEGSFLHDLSKVDFFSRFVTGSDPRRLFTTAIQFTLLVAVVALLPRMWRRLGPGYVAYVATVVAIPVVLTADFNGCGRYLVAAFPVTLVAAEALDGRRAVLGALVTSFAVGLVGLSVLYGHSWYLT